ncbi:DUF6950 family protein [Rhizobium sp. 11_C7_N12_5]|uniref:DUF6950 family protein n=1 Tax=Rhizobium sp. 11_C7_N12_5 TaxID=3240770 RepID=UPI003F202C29
MGSKVGMSQLVRRSDWRARFEAAVDEIKATPFEWGVHDCGPSFAGRLVLAVTGVDLAAQYAGSYSNEDEALAIVRHAGFATLGEMVASMLPEIHPSQARIGDVAAIKIDKPIGHALGVVNGERILVLMPSGGVGTVALTSASMAFKVG